MHGGGWWSYLQYDENDRPDVDRALLKRVWSYGRPYRLSLVGVLATVLVISGLTVVPPILTGRIVDGAIANADVGLLTLLGLGIVAVPVISTAVGVLQRYLSARAGEGIIYDLRRELYEHLQSMSLRFFTTTKTGELISRLNSDVVGAQQAITGTFVSILSNIVSVVAILIVMFGADWRLTILAVLALPLFVIPARRVGRLLRSVTERQMEHNASMAAILQETFNVSGALLVKLFNRAGTESGRFGVEAAAVRDLGVRRAMIGRWFFAAIGLVSAVGTAVVWWLGGWLAIRGEVTVGTLVMFGGLVAQLYGPLSAISNSRVEFATSLVSFERVFEILDLQTDLPVPLPETAIVPDRVVGRVAFEDVWFTYRSEGTPGLEAVKRLRRGGGVPGSADQGGGMDVSTREWALEDVSFVVEPGQLIALVGPSGAGKTTISYLVPRIYDVTRGRVTIDGHDVRDLDLGTLIEEVGVVTQETYLFHDTIGANLRYARLGASDEELRQACRAANILDLVDALPDGLETVVGERGYRLSGGEKQRIAIARVILKDPRILILDEATSHLDTRSEALIQDALESLMEDRTSLVIAHRLSTVRAADRILVIDHGRLVESGTHDELVGEGGLYARLHDTDFREREPA